MEPALASEACHPNLGAYHGALAAAIAAACAGHSLEHELDWQHQGGHHGFWSFREDLGDLTRYSAGEALPAIREVYTEGRP